MFLKKHPDIFHKIFTGCIQELFAAHELPGGQAGTAS
jgi:hypothetical protein